MNYPGLAPIVLFFAFRMPKKIKDEGGRMKDELFPALRLLLSYLRTALIPSEFYLVWYPSPLA